MQNRFIYVWDVEDHIVLFFFLIKTSETKIESWKHIELRNFGKVQPFSQITKNKSQKVYTTSEAFCIEHRLLVMFNEIANNRLFFKRFPKHDLQCFCSVAI